jgi:hypothetical protein
MFSEWQESMRLEVQDVRDDASTIHQNVLRLEQHISYMTQMI